MDHSRQTVAAMEGVVGRHSSTVLFLPMAHVFARFISVLFIAAGGRVAHTPDIKQLIEDLGMFRPTFLLGVPRVFEKIYNAAALKAEGDGKSASSPPRPTPRWTGPGPPPRVASR